MSATFLTLQATSMLSVAECAKQVLGGGHCGAGGGAGEGRGVASTCLHPVLLQMSLSSISQLCKLVTDPPQPLLTADTKCIQCKV